MTVLHFIGFFFLLRFFEFPFVFCLSFHSLEELDVDAKKQVYCLSPALLYADLLLAVTKFVFTLKVKFATCCLVLHLLAR